MKKAQIIQVALSSGLLTGIALGQASFERSDPAVFFKVPLAINGGPPNGQGAGELDRDADHGTVAMNNQRDIAVAFHSVRDDAQGTYSGELKQVELAYFEHQEVGGVESWTHVETVLLEV